MISRVDTRACRLTILATHPVQYQVPWFRALSADPQMELTVLFASSQGAQATMDPGFGMAFKWDVPLLDGYSWRVLQNVAAHPAVNTFWGTNVPEIRDFLRRDRPDAVIIPGWGRRMYLQAARACLSRKVPFFIRGEARPVPGQSLQKRVLKRLLVAPLVRRSAGLLCIGKLNREFYKWCGVPEAKVFDAPYFVDNEFFASRAREARPQRTELRRKWQLPPDGRVFLFAGKLIAKKRPLDLLHALGRFHSQQSSRAGKVAVLFVGEGQLRRECETLAREQGLPVSFGGFLNQTEMSQAYAAADCLVLPSDYSETWGLVVNEAMACGLPAIVSDRVGCGPDLVKEGITGYVFSFGNIEGLAEKMGLLARDENAAVSLGNAARKLVSSYTVARSVNGTREALASLKPGHQYV